MIDIICENPPAEDDGNVESEEIDAENEEIDVASSSIAVSGSELLPSKQEEPKDIENLREKGEFAAPE